MREYSILSPCMLHFLKRFLYPERKLCSSFENLSLLEPISTFEGLRLDYISSYRQIQFSHSLHSSQSSNLYYTGVVFPCKNIVAQLLVDSSKNAQLRLLTSYRALNLRFLLSRSQLLQLELEYAKERCSLHTRIVKSEETIMCTGSAVLSLYKKKNLQSVLIDNARNYIISNIKNTPQRTESSSFFIGLEATAIKREKKTSTGLSLCIKKVSERLVGALTLHGLRLLQLALSYKLKKGLELVAELQATKEIELLCSGGLILTSEKGTIRSEIDTLGRVALCAERKMGSNTLSASVELYKGKQPRIGLGLCIEK